MHRGLPTAKANPGLYRAEVQELLDAHPDFAEWVAILACPSPFEEEVTTPGEIVLKPKPKPAPAPAPAPTPTPATAAAAAAPPPAPATPPPAYSPASVAAPAPAAASGTAPALAVSAASAAAPAPAASPAVTAAEKRRASQSPQQQPVLKRRRDHPINYSTPPPEGEPLPPLKPANFKNLATLEKSADARAGTPSVSGTPVASGSVEQSASPPLHSSSAPQAPPSVSATAEKAASPVSSSPSDASPKSASGAQNIPPSTPSDGSVTPPSRDLFQGTPLSSPAVEKFKLPPVNPFEEPESEDEVMMGSPLAARTPQVPAAGSSLALVLKTTNRTKKANSRPARRASSRVEKKGKGKRKYKSKEFIGEETEEEEDELEEEVEEELDEDDAEPEVAQDQNGGGQDEMDEEEDGNGGVKFTGEIVQWLQNGDNLLQMLGHKHKTNLLGVIGTVLGTLESSGVLLDLLNAPLGRGIPGE